MPRTNGISTNRLAVYQIKSRYKSPADIVEAGTESIPVGAIGQFVYEASHTQQPDWITKFFVGRLPNLRIFNSSSKALFLAPVQDGNRTTYFAITFGHGRHLLKEGVTVDRFGLKVVLNSVSPESFRSIDKTTLGAVPKHSREQMSRDVSPAEFGIDIEQDLISSVTARSIDEKFGKMITGRDAFHFTAPVNVTNVSEILKYSLKQSRSRGYKENFDWIDQISEVGSGPTEDSLNAALLEKVNQRDLEKVWMAVPDVLDWADIAGFRYRRPKRGQLVNDLSLDAFLEEADAAVTIDDLKSDGVYAISATDDDQANKWSAFRCMYAEIPLNGVVHILNNGKWYKIARNFSDEIENYFASIPDSAIDLLDYTGGKELEYNTSATERLDGACCMDQKTITQGGGRSKIEFCDILTRDKKLVHVKKYGASSVLSHLFMQGVVSGELLVSDAEFRVRLNRILPRGHKLQEPRRRPNPSEYEVVYAIISGSPNPLNIPFFSKVSFRSARRRLESYGYTVTKKKISKA
ncbi:MAG: TIGR04141 family sporadically distributed protein [Silvibacterium sp.]